MSEQRTDEPAEAGSAGEAATEAGQAPASGKKPRSPKQQAQFEAMRAKRWAAKKADQARKAGVDTTGSHAPAVQPERAGAPKVVTTAHTSPPKPPEREQKDPAPPPKEAPADTGARRGLLGIIADGIGL